MPARRKGLPPVLLGSLGALGVFLGYLLATHPWGGPEKDADLHRGIQVVRYLSSPKSLRLSSFLAVFPEGKPSQFVQWMFSTLGTAEWPPSEETAPQGSMEAEQAKAIGAPTLPRGVAIVPRARNAASGRQVVVKADDARGLLIAEAFDAAGGDPLLIQKWPLKLPKNR